jgi:hypothetical protein
MNNGNLIYAIAQSDLYLCSLISFRIHGVETVAAPQRPPSVDVQETLIPEA